MFWGGVWTCKAEAKPTKTFGIDYMQKTGGWVSEKVGNITWGAGRAVQRMRIHALQSMHSWSARALIRRGWAVQHDVQGYWCAGRGTYRSSRRQGATQAAPQAGSHHTDFSRQLWREPGGGSCRPSMAFYAPDEATPRSQGVSRVQGGNGVAPARREEAESGRHPAPSRKVPTYFLDFAWVT